jgi:hypothetical protein
MKAKHIKITEGTVFVTDQEKPSMEFYIDKYGSPFTNDHNKALKAWEASLIEVDNVTDRLMMQTGLPKKDGIYPVEGMVYEVKEEQCIDSCFEGGKHPEPKAIVSFVSPQEESTSKESLQKEFEATGYASWINADTYPNGRIYTNEYVNWLEKQLTMYRQSF